MLEFSDAGGKLCFLVFCFFCSLVYSSRRFLSSDLRRFIFSSIVSYLPTFAFNVPPSFKYSIISALASSIACSFEAISAQDPDTVFLPHQAHHPPDQVSRLIGIFLHIIPSDLPCVSRDSSSPSQSVREVCITLLIRENLLVNHVHLTF